MSNAPFPRARLRRAARHGSRARYRRDKRVFAALRRSSRAFAAARDGDEEDADTRRCRLGAMRADARETRAVPVGDGIAALTRGDVIRRTCGARAASDDAPDVCVERARGVAVDARRRGDARDADADEKHARRHDNDADVDARECAGEECDDVAKEGTIEAGGVGEESRSRVEFQ